MRSKKKLYFCRKQRMKTLKMIESGVSLQAIGLYQVIAEQGSPVYYMQLFRIINAKSTNTLTKLLRQLEAAGYLSRFNAQNKVMYKINK